MKKNNQIQFHPDILNEIQFGDIFVLAEIQQMQDLFSDATGVASIITQPDGTPITQPSNFTRLCNNIIRKTEQGCANCYKSDAIIGGLNLSGPIVQQCLSGGLWDAGVSITVGGKHYANWLIGQIWNPEVDEERMIQYAVEIGANQADFLDALKEVPQMSVVQFRKVSNMLFAFANQLSEKAYSNMLLQSQIAERKKATELLIDSEIRFSNLFQDVQSISVQGYGLDGTTYYWNKASEDIYGYSAQEAIGRNLLELIIPPEMRDSVQQAMHFMAETGHPIPSSELTLMRKDGSPVTVFSSHTIIRRPGMEQELFCIDIDLTDHKNIEKALRKSEEKYRVLVDNAFEGIIIINLEGNILFANHSIIKTFEYESLEEIVGQNIFSHIAPEYIAQTIEDFAKVVRGNDDEVAVSCGITAKGNRIWLESIGKIIEYEGIKADLISVHDITAKKQADDRLIKLNECFLKFTSDSIININLLVALCGELLGATCALYNCISDEMLCSVGQWNTPDDYQAVDFREGHICNDVIKSKNDDICVIRNLDNTIYAHTDPNVKRYNLKTYVGKAVKFNYKNIGSICVVFQHDALMTQGDLHILEIIASAIGVEEDRKRSEQELVIAKENAEESDRLKSAFLANMSHEVRTPMNGILGFAELLKEPDLTGEMRNEYISIIETSGARMVNIINDIVDISKIESGQMNVSVSEMNINEKLDFILNFFKPEAEQKGLQISCAKLEQLQNAVIKTDREKVYAILVNLVKNAIKFTKKGSVEFGCLSTDVDTSKALSLTFFVKDTGIGIHPEQKAYIFERFRQGSESMNKRYEGAGLGLSISKAYVEMLGGTIWVESEVGKGSTFYFTIPAIHIPA